MDDLAQRPRDGRCRHEQHMRRAALCGQGLALGDAESMLLVDDHEPQVIEGDGILDQSVRAHHDAAARSTLGRRSERRAEQVQRLATRGRRHRTGQQQHVVAQRLEQRAERVGVLAGEQVGRCKQRAPGLRRRPPRPSPARRRRSCPSQRRPGAAASSAGRSPGRRESAFSASPDPASGSLRPPRAPRPPRIPGRGSRPRPPQSTPTIPLIVDRDGQRLLRPGAGAARDHADLEREQLVECKPQRAPGCSRRNRAGSASIRRPGQWAANRPPAPPDASGGRYSSKSGTAMSSAARIFVRRYAPVTPDGQPVDRNDAIGVQRALAGLARTRGSAKRGSQPRSSTLPDRATVWPAASRRSM